MSFHLFPNAKIVKKKWATNFIMGKLISPMRVTSQDFLVSNCFPNSKNIFEDNSHNRYIYPAMRSLTKIHATGSKNAQAKNNNLRITQSCCSGVESDVVMQSVLCFN